MSYMRDVCHAFYVAMRAIPYLWMHIRGRWHVFRDAPDWLVVELMQADECNDQDILTFSAAARAEYDLRLKRART